MPDRRIPGRRTSSRRIPGRRMTIRLAGVMAAACALTLMSSGASSAMPSRGSAAPSLAEIVGEGSSWAANAVDQWVGNIQSQGVNVVFTSNGSAAGRTDFANATTDFAVSDIGYQGKDPVTGGNDSSSRPYAYLPVTGGGTSFPYNISVGGQQITNLRLSGLTLAKIFTTQISNWDDPAITHDNNGRKLPSLPITTVVPSEGSGTTAMFSQYLNFEFPALWKSFYPHGGLTEYWPRTGSNQIAQDGSSQIINYVRSAAANGAIGLAEYSYALSVHLPVAQLENTAGYYVLPSEYNDAVALTQAQINLDKSSPDYLLQNLNNVYGYNDPRAYPLSSYSYTVMPTSSKDPRMAVSGSAFPAKWQSLADFLYYSICAGQENIGPIGYSALPINLVEAGFQQIEKIKAAAPAVNISQLNVSTCNNPTFIAGHPTQNYLAKIAPYPPLCDKTGQGPCVGVLNANANGGRGSTSPGGAGTTPGGTGSPGGAGSSAKPGATASQKALTGKIDPATGQYVGAGGTSATGGSVVGLPAVLPAGLTSNLNDYLGPLAVVLLLIALVAPPLLVRRLGRRRQP